MVKKQQNDTFLTEQDYKVVSDADDLDILTQSDTATRLNAERIAMEEVAGYLRGRYDMSLAYAARGNDRNTMLVQTIINIALYYLSHWLPGGMGGEVRLELYEKSIDWLTAVSKGTVMPDLPTYTDDDGNTDTANPVRYGGMKPSKYDY